ncbi:MAG: hypothetical protein EHM45_04580 [Desulfobacteraceae bacterium]|nr:MAG: hypothetical protein EHM45_04580 [Desulfobacteraceae bacterium]
MKKVILQIVMIAVLAALVFTGYLLINYALKLPFRATNDALHKKEALLNLDILIPAGFNIDEKVTIEQVIQVRFQKQRSLARKFLQTFADIIPTHYRYYADALLLAFWTFLYMTFFRVFTFMGYGRALRVSFFFGGITYFFMPDFSPGRWDDIIAICLPLAVIFGRIYLLRYFSDKPWSRD